MYKRQTQIGLNTELKDQIISLQEDLSNIKEGLTDKDVQDNKDALAIKLTDTEESLTNLGEAFTGFFQTNETSTGEHLSKIKEEYNNHFSSIKEDSGKALFKMAQYEGFLGVSIQARLNNTLNDYRNYFSEVKSLADDAYRHLGEKSVIGGSDNGDNNGTVLPRGFAELFHYPATDAIASAGGKMAADKVKNANDFTSFFSQGFLSQIEDTKGTSGQSAQNITVIVDFGDGQTKELSNRIEQVKNDRRGYTA